MTDKSTILCDWCADRLNFEDNEIYLYAENGVVRMSFDDRTNAKTWKYEKLLLMYIPTRYSLKIVKIVPKFPAVNSICFDIEFVLRRCQRQYTEVGTTQCGTRACDRLCFHLYWLYVEIMLVSYCACKESIHTSYSDYNGGGLVPLYESDGKAELSKFCGLLGVHERGISKTALLLVFSQCVACIVQRIRKDVAVIVLIGKCSGVVPPPSFWCTVHLVYLFTMISGLWQLLCGKLFAEQGN